MKICIPVPVAAFFLTLSILAMPLCSQTAKRTAAVPRTADGHPDLQGIWTNVTLTSVERPADLAGKATLSDAEAKAYEQRNIATGDIDEGTQNRVLQQAGSAGTGAYNNLFIDRGTELARVDGAKRTSLIIDPPDGKMPARVASQPRRAGVGMPGRPGPGDVKSRPLSERCIVGFGSTAGPPMLPVLYNNNYQIVQTPDNVMILVEMIHDARIIRMNGKHPSADLRFLLGDSIGHWEGDTLVVETTNFDPRTAFRGASPALRVIERFRREDSGTIVYRATIEDPATFSKPWTLEYPFLATRGPIYEYACHEGNYAIDDILGAAQPK
jgi:hypothetical protein